MSASYQLRRIKRALVCAAVRRYPSLVELLPAPAPLEVMRFCEPRHSELIVFLPGIGDVAEDFVQNGFVTDLRESACVCDAIVADAHFGYYVRRSMLERLRKDVIEPAQAAGYVHLGLAGISLGGFGALLYAMAHPQDVHSLILLAPYVGDSALVREIREAGSLAAWDSRLHDDDPARTLWRSLRAYVASGTCPLLARTYLGFGNRDRFVSGNALLAEMLPSQNVFTVRGGHNWRTWKKLWRMALAARASRTEQERIIRA